MRRSARPRQAASVRDRRTPLWRACALALLVLGPVLPAGASPAERAAPLEVPRGPLPGPEDAPAQTSTARIESAAHAYFARGYSDLPILARALLAAAQDPRDPVVIDQARRLAPRDPGVRFDAARLGRDPLDLFAAFSGLAASFPALLWLATWGGLTLGGALLLTAAVALIVASVRTLGLHGHALGHFAVPQDPPGWPGALGVGALLATLPLLGAGPFALLAIAGILALSRLRVTEAFSLALLLAVAGLILGPGLQHWAAAAVVPVERPALLAAWRLDRGQPLADDLHTLEREAARNPDDPILALARATAWKRFGDLERVQSTLASFPASASPALRARALNLQGIAALGLGDVRTAVRQLEQAHAVRESAAVLYNLSQAHGRALELGEQTTLFAEARALDADLVTRYTSYEGANLHRYLIELPLPPVVWLGHSLRTSPAGDELAAWLRRSLLGPHALARFWWLLPACGALGLLIRRRSILRCSRCMRAVCQSCGPEASAGGLTCVRCAKLGAPDSRSDDRMRKRHLLLDRGRRMGMGRLLAGLGLLLPGTPRLLEGSVVRGSLQLLLLAVAFASLVAARQVAAPAEVGALAWALPFGLAAVCVALAWGWALQEAIGRLRAARGMA